MTAHRVRWILPLLVLGTLHLPAWSGDYFPLNENAKWLYNSSESPDAPQTATLVPETGKNGEKLWKQEVRTKQGKLIESSWFARKKDGIYLLRTMRLEKATTVTVELSEPQLYLSNDPTKQRTWAGTAPNSTFLVELSVNNTPIKVRVNANWKYQSVVEETPEKVGDWNAVVVKETSLLEIVSAKVDTGNPEMDDMLEQLLTQTTNVPFQAGTALHWSATRWFAEGVGEVKTEEVGTAPNGKKDSRRRTLLSFEKGR